MCSRDTSGRDPSRGESDPIKPCSGRGGTDDSSRTIRIVTAAFPTRATYGEDLSVTVTLQNQTNTEQSRTLDLRGESHGVPVSLTQATVYVPGNSTVQHELTTPATPAGLSELFLNNTEHRSSVQISPIEATIGDQIALPDGTILRPTTVEQTADATALYLDVVEQGRDGPPDRLLFSEYTQDVLAPEVGDFDRLSGDWTPLYTNSQTGGWLIFLPRTDTVRLRGEGLRAIISLSTEQA